MRAGNRRRRRERHLLDVKVETQGRTRRRARWLAAILSAVVVLAFTTYGSYRLAHVAVSRLLYDNPRFAIAQIVVEDDGALTPQQVVKLAGVQIGENLLSLDLVQIQQNLEMVPVIRRVEVRRMLPQRLFIHVEERVAVARLHVPSDSVFLIDRMGVVMKPLKLGDGTVLQPQTLGSVPSLTGVTLADAQVGRQVQSEQIYRALALLDRLHQAAAGAMLEIESIDLSRPRQLMLTTRQRTMVKFDVEEFPQQLRRLAVILSWAQQRQKLVQSVDLTPSRGVPVIFVN